MQMETCHACELEGRCCTPCGQTLHIGWIPMMCDRAGVHSERLRDVAVLRSRVSAMGGDCWIVARAVGECVCMCFEIAQAVVSCTGASVVYAGAASARTASASHVTEDQSLPRGSVPLAEDACGATRRNEAVSRRIVTTAARDGTGSLFRQMGSSEVVPVVVDPCGSAAC